MRIKYVRMAAFGLVYGIRTAARLLDTKEFYVLAAIRMIQDESGLVLIDSRQKSNKVGMAWAAVAMRVARSSDDLLKIAAPLQDRSPKREKIELDTICKYSGAGRKEVSGWIGINIVNKVGFITIKGEIIKPSLDELCKHIDNLLAVTEALKASSSALQTPSAS